jgi:site-specific recombinase XerD
MSVRVVLDKLTALHCIAGDRGGAVDEANRFLRALRLRGLSPNTIRAYAYDLVAIYRWLKPPSKRVAKLRQSDLVGFIAEQRQSCLSARTINRRLTVCRLLYRFLTDRDMDRGRGLSAPSGHYQGPGRDKNLGLYTMPRRQRLPLQVKVPRTVVEPLQVEQIKIVLGIVKRYRDLAIIHLMLLCGLRSNEVLTLRLIDLCFEDNRVRVHGKGNKERVLPLPQALVQLLGDYLRLERPGRCDTDRLFVVLQGKRTGQPMTPCGLRSLLRYRRGSRPGIGNANAHRFRHTFGTDMARAGVRLPVLQKMMGHANSATTLQYVNLSMADIANEYQRAINQIQQRYRLPHKADK